MAAEQFSAPVRGAAGQPLATTTAGSIQTDNYPSGGGFDYDGTAYPYVIEATSVNAIQEVMLTEAGNIEMEVDTVQGENFSVPLKSTVGRWQIWEIQTVTFSDPDGTGAELAGAWGGE